MSRFLWTICWEMNSGCGGKALWLAQHHSGWQTQHHMPEHKGLHWLQSRLWGNISVIWTKAVIHARHTHTKPQEACTGACVDIEMEAITSLEIKMFRVVFRKRSHCGIGSWECMQWHRLPLYVCTLHAISLNIFPLNLWRAKKESAKQKFLMNFWMPWSKFHKLADA